MASNNFGPSIASLFPTGSSGSNRHREWDSDSILRCGGLSQSGATWASHFKGQKLTQIITWFVDANCEFQKKKCSAHNISVLARKMKWFLTRKAIPSLSDLAVARNRSSDNSAIADIIIGLGYATGGRGKRDIRNKGEMWNSVPNLIIVRYVILL